MTRYESSNPNSQRPHWRDYFVFREKTFLALCRGGWICRRRRTRAAPDSRTISSFAVERRDRFRIYRRVTRDVLAESRDCGRRISGRWKTGDGAGRGIFCSRPKLSGRNIHRRWNHWRDSFALAV